MKTKSRYCTNPRKNKNVLTHHDDDDAKRLLDARKSYIMLFKPAM